MRYWVFDERTRKVHGPHIAMTLPEQLGFGPESKVAPEGARGAKDWKRAKDVDELKILFAAAAPAPAPVPAPVEKKAG
jgi:hypothetical protein